MRGHSMGGTTGMMLAARHPELPKITNQPQRFQGEVKAFLAAP